MSKIIEVTDLSLPGLEVYTRLTEAQLRSRLEPEKGVFIAESPKVIGTALDAGLEPVSLLMERRHVEGQARGIIARCGEIPVYAAGGSLLEGLTGYRLTRAVLENVMNPTNIGAIFRSAAALGMDAVLVTPGCCDPLNRRAVRVSMGAVFQVPWTCIGSESPDWPQPGILSLQRLGFKTAAMALSDASVGIDAPQLQEEEKLAIVLGAEGDGLAPRTIAACDYSVRIPMSHNVDSLNVAAASAVAFWQLRGR